MQHVVQLACPCRRSSAAPPTPPPAAPRLSAGTRRPRRRARQVSGAGRGWGRPRCPLPAGPGAAAAAAAVVVVPCWGRAPARAGVCEGERGGCRASPRARSPAGGESALSGAAASPRRLPPHTRRTRPCPSRWPARRCRRAAPRSGGKAARARGEAAPSPPLEALPGPWRPRRAGREHRGRRLSARAGGRPGPVRRCPAGDPAGGGG